METVSPWAWRIPIEVAKDKEKFSINTPRTFNELIEGLRDRKIFKGVTLEFLNDLGEKIQITDDKSYFEFLTCSNGFCHFLDVKLGAIGSTGSKETIAYDETSPWKCIFCHFENKPDQRSCLMCKFPRQ